MEPKKFAPTATTWVVLAVEAIVLLAAIGATILLSVGPADTKRDLFQVVALIPLAYAAALGGMVIVIKRARR